MIDFNSWKLSQDKGRIVSSPYPNLESAEEALRELKREYADINFCLYHSKRVAESSIALSRYDIHLGSYRRYPQLADRIHALWKEQFIRPDSRVQIVEGIQVYNERTKIYDREEFLAKLERRFEEAQRLLGRKSFGNWDAVCCGVDVSSSEDSDDDWPTYSISTRSFPSCNPAPRRIDAAGATTKGIKRFQEDRIALDELQVGQHNIAFFAVFDGHAGQTTSEYLENNIYASLHDCLAFPVNLDDPYMRDHIIFSSLKLLFLQMARRFKAEHPDDTSGSTAVLALIIDRALWVVNVGDSRAILCSNGTVTALSIDAELQTEKECRSVWKRGNNVFVTADRGTRRVGRLNMSRAVNHDEETSGVNPRGQIIKYDLNRLEAEENHLVLACDGLFDIATSEQVAERVHFLSSCKPSCREIAEELVRDAFEAKSGDNISVVVARL